MPQAIRSARGVIGLGCLAALCSLTSLPSAALAQVHDASQAAGLAATRAPSPWSVLEEMPPDVLASEAWIRPQSFVATTLDVQAMRALLAQAPLEGEGLLLELPRPDGTLAYFMVHESPVMEPELQARFPQIRTYCGQGVDEPAESVRFDLTPAGFHAQVLGPRGSWYIDPVSRGDTTHYASYWRRDLRTRGMFQCLTPNFDGQPDIEQQAGEIENNIGPTLVTYRLAVATSGEYTAFHGGTVAGGLAAVVTSVNRVTGIYETELGIRLTLVAQNDQFIYTNAATDIFTTPGPNDTSMTAAQNRFNAVLTTAGYDVGHLYHRAANSGVAGGIGTVCSTTKGRGVSQTEPPVGDPFSVDYVAHELGHQFGGRHSFNNCNGGPGDAADIAHEPGSGITIMGYAGICGSNNLASNSVPHFASVNYDQIRAYVNGAGICRVASATGNQMPTVTIVGNALTIPANTPFVLTAIGSDPDGDALTFSWEQRNGGAAAPLVGLIDNGANPLFRFEAPTTSPVRYIPRLSSLANNTFFPGEILPTTVRGLNFRVVARDNRAGGGGLDSRNVTIGVYVDPSGAFRVTSPSTSENWIAGETRSVSWNVANTVLPAINAQNVSVWFSTDNGQTWPIQLLASTPNDGHATFIAPSVDTTQGRIMVRAINNIFFNINQGGVINVRASLPGVDLRASGAPTITDNTGNGNNNARIDPGESAIRVNVPIANLGLTTATNVRGTLTSLTPMASVVSNTSTYADLPFLTQNALNTLPYVLAVDASHPCGQPIALQLAVTSDQGSGSFTFNVASGIPGGPGPATRYIYGGPPATLALNATTPLSVPLTVAGPTGVIADINFSFDGTTCSTADAATTNGVTQTWNGDMTYTLISPAGTRVTLMANRGGSGNHVCNALFDDSAANAIASTGTNVVNLFTGSWRPETPLSGFVGQNANGVWRVEMADIFPSADAATLRAFSLYVSNLQPPLCEPPTTACDDIDFNNNNVFPEDQDVIDFFVVLAGGPCSEGNTCNDIDFNNNAVFPEDQDVIDFFNVLAGAECP
jgi:Metallo-peptidase family M12B Reprolysin-like/Proprotein convertase P-domain